MEQLPFYITRLCKSHLTQAAELERLCFAEPWSVRALELLLGDEAVGFAAIYDSTKKPMLPEKSDEAEPNLIAYGGMLLAPDEGQITSLAVHPSFRHLGAGRAVLRELLADAQRRLLRQVVLEVRASNLPAISLYRSEGFSEWGRRKSFYRFPTEDALVMGTAVPDGMSDASRFKM